MQSCKNARRMHFRNRYLLISFHYGAPQRRSTECKSKSNTFITHSSHWTHLNFINPSFCAVMCNNWTKEAKKKDLPLTTRNTRNKWSRISYIVYHMIPPYHAHACNNIHHWIMVQIDCCYIKNVETMQSSAIAHHRYLHKMFKRRKFLPWRLHDLFLILFLNQIFL